MAGSAARIQRAAETHRRAAAIAAAAGAAVAGYVPRPRSATEERSIRELAERLRVAAAQLAPGWLGARLDAVPASTPLLAGPPRDGPPRDGPPLAAPVMVRIGTAYPLDDASFPVVVPLGHVAFDGDARDARVAGALRALLLRLLASAHAGSVLVRAVDPSATTPGATGAGGAVLAPFAPLRDAGIMSPPVTDRDGLRALLGEAEQRVRAGPGGRTWLLAVASWPQATEAEDLARFAELATAGPAAGLHLLVAGWPPPPLADSTAATGPLPHATQVTLRNPYALVGHPPGGSFAAPVPPDQVRSGALNAEVFLDRPPAPDLIARVCGDLAARATEAARVTLGELLPGGPLWTEQAGDQLAAVVGRSGSAPVTLRLGGATPHWLIVGRAGSGKTTMLQEILYGLCTRYGPDQLAVYLLDLTGRGSFADFLPSTTDPSSLPHAKLVMAGPDRQDGLVALRALAGQLSQRDPATARPPRIACLVDEVEAVDGWGGEAAELLGTLAQQGGPLGVHLILSGRAVPPAAVAARCLVRIALPGGSDALDPANQAAAALALGTAVVNTAGGLGGPRGATRAHEQLVHFPDPRPERAALAGLRHRLWQGQAGGGVA
ncbi:MAG: hypothetical protein GEV12_11180 [Micromonosporaceae bacterium]|nr:hypothetical protein [Micromonosporaceae bacterium]